MAYKVCQFPVGFSFSESFTREDSTLSTTSLAEFESLEHEGNHRVALDYIGHCRQLLTDTNNRL